MRTINEFRKAGWTAKNNNPRGCSGFWTIAAPSGNEYEVDLGEQRRWIVAYDGGREGTDAGTFGDALEAVFYIEQGRN